MALPGPLITRAKLMLRGQQLADGRNSQFVGNGTVTINSTTGLVENEDNDELRTVCDEKCATLYNMLVDLYENYSVKRGTISLVANQELYPLPMDFIKLTRVFYTDGNTGRRIQIPRVRVEEQSNSVDNTTFIGPPVSYEMLGQQIQFAPMPAADSVDAVELQYVPLWTPPERDDEPINFPMALGWSSYVHAAIAAYYRIKGNEPWDDMAALMSDFESKLKQSAANRDANHPPRVRDVGWEESNMSLGRNWGPW